jgi:hypothetical protein
MKIKFNNTQEWNRAIHEEFCNKTNEVLQLKELRDFIETNAFGFGERSFYWMWKLIVDELPDNFTFLEIGVFRGQTLALIKLLAKLAGKKCTVYGVTPLDSTDGHWESDYAADIKLLHSKFKLAQPKIIKGLSTDENIIKLTNNKYNIVYIDGGHEYEIIKSDLKNYPQMATDYLVIDDCANKFQIPFGMFAGIESVSNAVDEFLPPYTNNESFIYLGNIVHNRIWRTK